jgi:hypothetical protein
MVIRTQDSANASRLSEALRKTAMVQGVPLVTDG